MLLYSYKNGSNKTLLYKNGTKVFVGSGKRDFPDSMDVKITNYCDAGCSRCHEQSTTEGKHGKLDLFLQGIKQLPKGIEIAIGGGNPLDHPDILHFLKELKSNGYVPNITVNSIHQHMITQEVIDNVYGIGISYGMPIKIKTEHTVIHFIAGVHSIEIIKKHLQDGYKCLILGYKLRGRGVEYMSDKVKERIKILSDRLGELKGQLAFDSLAVTQLNPQNIVSKEYREKHYTGSDGTLSMYFDLVKGEYCKNSFAPKRHIFDGNIFTSFQKIQYD